MRLRSFDDTEVCNLVHFTSLLYRLTSLSDGFGDIMPISRTSYV